MCMIHRKMHGTIFQHCQSPSYLRVQRRSTEGFMFSEVLQMLEKVWNYFQPLSYMIPAFGRSQHKENCPHTGGNSKQNTEINLKIRDLSRKRTQWGIPVTEFIEVWNVYNSKNAIQFSFPDKFVEEFKNADFEGLPLDVESPEYKSPVRFPFNFTFGATYKF